MEQQEAISDATMRQELVGTCLLLSPLCQHISSQRGAMFGRNLPQAMIVDGCETARIQSGYETKYGRYCIDPAARDHDAQILDIIPKFASISNEVGGMIHNPLSYVLYLDVETPEPTVDYFEVPDYVFLHNKFGYHTKKHNMNHLVANNFIPKDMKFVEAPNHDDELYNLGVNANVIYMPLWGTTNDAFIISESFKEKLKYTEVNQKVIPIGLNYIPLNLYGDENNYKAFPDIGETVNDSGCIFAMREHNADSLIADITPESLRKTSTHDERYPAPVGAKVLDVTIFINKNRYNDLRQADKKEVGYSSTYAQFLRYQNSLNTCYTAIIDCYFKYKDQYRISPKFSSLVKEAMSWCYNDKYKDLSLYCKKDPIDFMYLVLTYSSKQNVTLGNKITSRDGAKGVISQIRPREDMPYYQNGSRRVYADLVITGESPFNRLNTSQNYEQYINYASDVIVQRCRDGLIPREKMYDYIMHFIGLIRPIYEKFLREETANNPDEFIDTVLNEGIYYIIIPFCNNITPEMVLRVSQEYDVHQAPIYYNEIDEHGNKYQVAVKDKTIIGSKYVMLLGKLPIDTLSAIEFGYTSQFNLPIKPTSNDIKQQNRFNCTPNRWGEDETAITTASAGARTVVRTLGMYSNCTAAQDLLKKHLLLDPYPTRLQNVEMSDEEVILQAGNVKLFAHMFAAAGYQLSPVPNNAKPKERPQIPLLNVDTANKPEIPIYPMNRNASGVLRLTYEDYAQPYFVESMFKQKQDYGTCELVMSDSRILINTRLAMLNIVLWECLMKFGIRPSSKELCNVKSFTCSLISTIQSKFYFKILTKLSADGRDMKNVEHMEIVQAFGCNINRLYNIICRYLNAYMPPMDALGLAETCNNPEIKKLIDEKIDPSVGTQLAEKKIKMQTKELIDLISKPGLKHNILLPYMNASTLKSNQIPHEILKYGPRSDVDDRMCHHVINESSFSGIKSAADFAIESLSAKKCSFLNKTVLKKAQYTNRKTRLAGTLLTTLYPGWCGSTRTIPFFIEPEFASNMYLKSIVVDDKIVQLTKENIGQYVNTTVNMLSVFGCNHTDGFCERCAGFRYWPEYDIGLHLFLPKGIHIGLMATSQLMSRVTQKILSNKHLIATNTKTYKLPVETEKYLSAEADSGIYWRHEKGSGIPKAMKSWAIRIPDDCMCQLSDLDLDQLPEPEIFSKISYFDLLDMSNDYQVIDSIHMEADGCIPHLSKDMLEYMRDCYESILNQDNSYIVPMNNFPVKKPFMEYTVMNDDLVGYVGSFASFIGTEISMYTSVNKCLHDFAKLVYRKSEINMFYLEVILRALNCVSKTDYRIPVIEDPDHTHFMRLDDKVTAASISLKLAQEQILRYLRDSNAFLQPNFTGLFGPFFGLV